MNKYHSRKITRDGITFDSTREYRRYCELKLLERAGQISTPERQVKFVLIPAQYEGEGKSRRCIERECAYIADFAYLENGILVVEDAKGFRTKDYIIKRKLMLYMHGIRIREV